MELRLLAVKTVVPRLQASNPGTDRGVTIEIAMYQLIVITNTYIVSKY
jgi:hypothetical protein